MGDVRQERGMELDQKIIDSLGNFVEHSSFGNRGGVMTDLDGTAIHENAGRIYIPKPVEMGLKALHDLGRPFVLNTLRFPLSVIRTFGRDWYRVSGSPIPTVTLNGSLIGYVTVTKEDEMTFEEIAAEPMNDEDIEGVLAIVEQLVDDGLKNVLLFYYPRDWRLGEIIWTPVAERIMPVKEKYMSASSVHAAVLPKLRDMLHDEEICMIFLLIDATEKQLMSYQHTRRNNFFTSGKTDKLAGARRAAQILGFDLAGSLGAGDTELDRFLNGVGCAILVGGIPLEFSGLIETIQLRDSFEFGALLFRLADMIKAAG